MVFSLIIAVILKNKMVFLMCFAQFYDSFN